MPIYKFTHLPIYPLNLYPENIEDKISFSEVRDLLRQRCTCLLGREEVDAVTFLTDPGTIALRLKEGDEMRRILEDASLAYPEPQLYDLRESLARIRIEGLFLDEEELVALRATLDAVCQYLQFFASLPADRFEALRGLRPIDVFTEEGELVPEVPYKQLLQELDSLLDKYGQLRDSASPELARIRRELRQSQGSVSRVLNTILRQAQADGLVSQDVVPTLREGRLVIPVSPAYKRKLGGIVHDESATGKTVYVEPQQVVEANNRIRELESEERRERNRILMAFTATLRPYAPGLRAAEQYLGHIDFVRAKGRFARDLKAIAPAMQTQPGLDWHQARHPLLYLNFSRQHKEVVPLDIRLGGKQRLLVISGPNAGGKSVCLKTVALLQYMLQCGLPVPVGEDSTFGLFRSVFIDIGDEQDMENDLSTYSSHLRNMKHFVRYAGHDTLLLIDEFGGGTEPQIGGAIAEAVLSRLNDNGAYGVITTHYTNLKHFAEKHEGVINGAMLYDRGALRPLFQLSIGQPGSSFAIEIARQIGLSEEIISHAKELVGEENILYDKHLQDIARDKRYWADKRKQVHDKEKRLNELEARYEAEMADVKQKKREVLRQAKEEAAELLAESNRAIEQTIRQIKEAKADKERTRQVRARLQKQKEKVQVKDTPAPTEGKQRVFRDLSDLRALTSRQDTPAAQQPQSGPGGRLTGGLVAGSQNKSLTSSYLHQRKLTFQREIDLRGFRADEALQEVQDFIDTAIMCGAPEVTILHGTGTGVLKQVLRDYLRAQRKVRGFRDGDPNHGGAGITIVEF